MYVRPWQFWNGGRTRTLISSDPRDSQSLCLKFIALPGEKKRKVVAVVIPSMHAMRAMLSRADKPAGGRVKNRPTPTPRARKLSL